jgi:hypothetical protein
MARKKKVQEEIKDREWIITQALLQGWKVYHKEKTYNNAIQITDKAFSVHVGSMGGVLNLSDTIEELEKFDALTNWTWDENSTAQVGEKPAPKVIVLELGASKKKGRK